MEEMALWSCEGVLKPKELAIKPSIIDGQSEVSKYASVLLGSKKNFNLPSSKKSTPIIVGGGTPLIIFTGTCNGILTFILLILK